jgi:nitrous oxidase accessory protein
MKFFINIFILTILASASFGKVLNVGKNQTWRTIRSAVESAKSGDTIMVHSGTYREGNILIQKSIYLMGVNKPVLDGENKHELLTINATHVTVKGFHLMKSGRSSVNDLAGIKCLDAHYVSIIGNRFDETFFGIHLSNSDHAVIRNNQLSASGVNEYELGNGIHLWKCNHAAISGNTVTGHRDGIYFEFVTHTAIENNLSRNNKRYGLHFMFSHENRYENNTFSNNGAGVAVMYTRFVKMYNNRFEKNWGSASYGLLLKDITDSEVRGNVFDGNTSGIYMEGTSRTHFHRNTFSSNGWAIKLQASCDGNTFEFNNFSSNTFDIATNGMLVLNNIDRNYWDRYQGYDLNRDGVGDIPHRPVNLFSMIVESVPSAMLLWRSFLVFLLDKAEKVMPAITPENLKDNYPVMRPYALR